MLGTARVPPEMTLFHSKHVSASIVTMFLQDVAADCGNFIYPFGQHEDLCLEKGNPSSSPVSLREIDKSYRLAWPVASIGYAEHCRSRRSLSFHLYAIYSLLWVGRPNRDIC